MKYKVQVTNGHDHIDYDYLRGLTEEEAIFICEKYGETFVDEKGNVWRLDYVEDEE